MPQTLAVADHFDLCTARRQPVFQFVCERLGIDQHRLNSPVLQRAAKTHVYFFLAGPGTRR